MDELGERIGSALRQVVPDAPPGRTGDGTDRIEDVRARARRFAGRRRRTRAVIGGLACGVIVLGLVALSLSTTRRSDWAASTSFTRLERDGLAIDVPEGWWAQPADGPGGNPARVFVLGSRDVGARASCDDRGFADPTATDLRPSDVVVEIRERYPAAGAPPSPPVDGRPDELNASTMRVEGACHNVAARYYRTGFIDGGRQFDVILITGDEASTGSTALGWEVLDRFEVLREQ